MKARALFLALILVALPATFPASTFASYGPGQFAWDSSFGGPVDLNCNSNNYWQVVLYKNDYGTENNPHAKVCSNQPIFKDIPLTQFDGANDRVTDVRYVKLNFPPPGSGCHHHIVMYQETWYQKPPFWDATATYMLITNRAWSPPNPQLYVAYTTDPYNDTHSSLQNICVAPS